MTNAAMAVRRMMRSFVMSFMFSSRSAVAEPVEALSSAYGGQETEFCLYLAP